MTYGHAWGQGEGSSPTGGGSSFLSCWGLHEHRERIIWRGLVRQDYIYVWDFALRIAKYLPKLQFPTPQTWDLGNEVPTTVTEQADSAYQLHVLLLCPWPLTHLFSHSHHVTVTLTLLTSTLGRLGTSLGALLPLCDCGKFQVLIFDELQLDRKKVLLGGGSHYVSVLSCVVDCWLLPDIYRQQGSTSLPQNKWNKIEQEALMRSHGSVVVI